MTLSPLLTQIVVVFFAAGLTFLAARYWYTRHVRDAKVAEAIRDKEELQDRVTALEKQLLAFSSEVQPISEAFRAILIKQLTHFHTPVLDALMQKIGPPNTLTEPEMKLLCDELQKREKDMGPMIDDSERNAAKLLPLLVERMRIETADKPTDALQLVAVPVPPEEVPPKKEDPE